MTCIPKSLVDNLKKRLEKGEITAEEIAKMLPEEKAQLKALLEDFVADKLGISVSKSEIEGIQVRAKKIDEAQKRLGDDIGNPAKEKDIIDFFAAKKQMDDFLNNLNPSNRLRILTGTIGRGMMLFSVKSPLLNIGSNIELALTEGLSRRVASGNLKGANNALAKDYVKLANKVYQKTGYDISRMTSLKDEVSGERFLGKVTHSQGKGAIRKVGRFVEDTVFKQMMGAPDVAFASLHFADSVNLNALKIAKGNKAEASSLMRDAMRLEPRTPEGTLLREQAILDAQVATWTNKTWASDVSEKVRKIFNDISGDARVGDYIFPFVKTPSNVIATGMDYAGAGIPKAVFKAVKAFRSGDLGNKQNIQSIARDLIRSGLGLTGAAIIAYQLNDDDFVGAYDPARAQIEGLRNSNYNAIRVGDKWISADWLGPLSVPVTAIMYARKYGDTIPEGGFQYGKAVASSALNIPGVKDISELVKSQQYKQNQTLEEMTGSAADYITSQAYTRLVPSFISDTAKAIDPVQRQTGKGIEGIKAKIPFLSTTLPEKKNVFGETVKGEPAWSDILFGARLKTDRETPMIKELNKVSSDVGKSINFTDWDKSSSKTLAQFKEKIGALRFNQAKQAYGKELKKELELAIKSSNYKSWSNEDKLKKINSLDMEVMNKIFKQYGFKYKAAPTKKLNL